MSWTMEQAKDKIKQAGPDQAKGYFRLALYYYLDQDYNGAAAFLQLLERQYKDFKVAEVEEKLGDCYFKRQDKDV